MTAAAWLLALGGPTVGTWLLALGGPTVGILVALLYRARAKRAADQRDVMARELEAHRTALAKAIDQRLVLVKKVALAVADAEEKARVYEEVLRETVTADSARALAARVNDLLQKRRQARAVASSDPGGGAVPADSGSAASGR